MHRRGRGRRVETRTLIVDKKEQFVLLDRTADSPAEFIPAQFGRCAVDGWIGTEVPGPFIGIEEVVAQKLEEVAVELVGTGLGADADHAAQELAILGARDCW